MPFPIPRTFRGVLRFVPRQQEPNPALRTLQNTIEGTFALGANHQHGGGLEGRRGGLTSKTEQEDYTGPAEKTISPSDI